MAQAASLPEQPSGSPYRRLFRNRNFVALWLGQLISFIGDYFYFLAIPLVVNRLTGSALLVGLSAIASALPALLFGPVAGVFVDRWDRRQTMITADLVRAGLVLVCLVVRSSEQVWIFYLIGFLMASTAMFFFPARNALLPLIVTGKQDWLQANGLMQIIQTVGLLAGPALAGFAIGIWGESAAFVVNAVGFLASALAVFTIRLSGTRPERDPQSGVSAVWSDLKEGLRFIFSSRTLVGLLSASMMIMLGVGAINAVWVPFLQRTFGVGASGLGLVDSAQGAGMVVSGLALSWLAARMSKKALVGWGILVCGVSLAAMGLAPAFGFVLAFGVFIGLGLTPAQSGLNTIMQLAVPDAKRGRVGSSMNAMTTTASLVSMAIAAGLGEWIGLRTVYLLFGAIVAVAGLLGFWLIEEPREDTPA